MASPAPSCTLPCSGVLGTAGLDMHLPVRGRDKSGQRCRRLGGSGRAHCPSSRSTPCEGSLKARGTLPRPSTQPLSCFDSPRLPSRGRDPGAARAGTEAAVPGPVAGAAPGLSGDDSAERSMTGLLGTETHAGRSVLTAGHPCHDEGPDLPQGSRRRFSLS